VQYILYTKCIFNFFKVPVKAVVQKNCKHITNVLLQHITKFVNCEVLNCAVRPLNSFTPLPFSGFFGLKQGTIRISSALNRELLSVLLVTTTYSFLANYLFDTEMRGLLFGCDHVQNRSVFLFKYPKNDHIKKRWINFVESHLDEELRITEFLYVQSTNRPQF